jgi:hypothetical protein
MSVAHAYNPSYSRERSGSRSKQIIIIIIIPNTKKGWQSGSSGRAPT